jgi:hypothetical protein
MARSKKSSTLERRAHHLKVAREINKGKAAALDALCAEWRRTAIEAFDWLWDGFLRCGEITWSAPRSGPNSTFPETRLVTSQKDMLAVALEGQAKGWLSNLASRGRPNFAAVSDPTLRHELLWINVMKLWGASNARQNTLLTKQNTERCAKHLQACLGAWDKSSKLEDLEARLQKIPERPDLLERVAPTATRYARRWLRKYLERYRLPNPENLSVQFNQLSGLVSRATKTKHGYFQHWARVSTLERRKPIYLPVEGNPYFEKKAGSLANSPWPKVRSSRFMVRLRSPFCPAKASASMTTTRGRRASRMVRNHRWTFVFRKPRTRSTSR